MTTHKPTVVTKADTKDAAPALDAATVREMFAVFNDRAAFFADPEGTWVDRPHYRVIPQNLEMHTREEVVSWFRGFFGALPDLHMEVEDVVVAGQPGRERVTLRWHISGTFTGEPFAGIASTGRPIDLYGMDLLDFDNGRGGGQLHLLRPALSFARQVGMLPSEGSLGDRLMTGAFNLTVGARKRLRRIR